MEEPQQSQAQEEEEEEEGPPQSSGSLSSSSSIRNNKRRPEPYDDEKQSFSSHPDEHPPRGGVMFAEDDDDDDKAGKKNPMISGGGVIIDMNGDIVEGGMDDDDDDDDENNNITMIAGGDAFLRSTMNHSTMRSTTMTSLEYYDYEKELAGDDDDDDDDDDDEYDDDEYDEDDGGSWDSWASKRVHFSTVTVRHYDITIGDNPCCSDGPPLSLDWGYVVSEPVKLDQFEATHKPRRSRRRLLLDQYKRRDMLWRAGYDLNQIKKATHQIELEKWKRSITLFFQPIYTAQEAVITAMHKVTRKSDQLRIYHHTHNANHNHSDEEQPTPPRDKRLKHSTNYSMSSEDSDDQRQQQQQQKSAMKKQLPKQQPHENQQQQQHATTTDVKTTPRKRKKRKKRPPERKLSWVAPPPSGYNSSSDDDSSHKNSSCDADAASSTNENDTNNNGLPPPTRKKRYNISVDRTQGDKATTVIICNFQRPHMRAFHFSWLSFFIAFFTWFSITPLLGEVQDSLNLTRQQIWTSSLCGTAGTILMRIIMGPACDKFGARYCMAFILISSAIPTALTGLVQTSTALYIVRTFVGVAGSSFVACQYWTSSMFAREVAGTANAIVAGWGNLGGGVTQIVIGSLLFPLFQLIYTTRDIKFYVLGTEPGTDEPQQDIVIEQDYDNNIDIVLLQQEQEQYQMQLQQGGGGGETMFYTNNTILDNITTLFTTTESPTLLQEDNDMSTSEKAWRTVFIVPALISILTAICLLVYSDDSPKGDYRTRLRQQEIEVINPTASLLAAAKNINTWVMVVQYACCFGVEVTMTNATALYFREHFAQTTVNAAAIASIFGFMNLFARGLGGGLSDYCNNFFNSIKGRLGCQSICLLLEGGSIILFAYADTLVGSIFALIFCSIMVQASEGSSFGIVPYIDRRRTGSVVGWVGAGGNVGGVVFAIFFRQYSYEKAFTLMGITSALSAFLCLFVDTKSLAKSQRRINGGSGSSSGGSSGSGSASASASGDNVSIGSSSISSTSNHNNNNNNINNNKRKEN